MVTIYQDKTRATRNDFIEHILKNIRDVRGTSGAYDRFRNNTNARNNCAGRLDGGQNGFRLTGGSNYSY